MMAGRRRADAEECKMFVGGLTRDTTSDMLRGYFNNFGPVAHAVVMTNPETQKSRGFGFVSFEHPDIVDRVLMTGAHFLDGKQIDPKPSVPKDLRPKPPQVEQPKKAFLGGLPLEMNEADLREFFSSYGVVTECYIMFDEKRMKSRGFGFVSFEDDTIVDELVSHHYITVRDKRVEVKLARPRENPLAPLNSEGRVLSVESQQQRIAAASAAAAATIPARHRPAPYSTDWHSYGDSQRRPNQSWHDPEPVAKRPRTSNLRPLPMATPDRYPDYDVGYSYDEYYSRPSSHREVSPPGVGRGSRMTVDHRSSALKALPSSTSTSTGGQSTSAAAAAFLGSYGSSPGQNSMTNNASGMTPESVTSLMQQTMQNMGGVGMNMMMPMVMSNMMTQMFMSQAQSMFQSLMKEHKPTSSESSSTNKAGKTDVDASGTSSSNANVMEIMKNVLQTLMSSAQQQAAEASNE